MSEFIGSILSNREIIFCFRILLAFAIGWAIGYQRRRIKHDSAILRVHVLVCMGATIISAVGQLLAESYNIDPTRMAAQVVSGIGFLGMGVIFKDKDNQNIVGLTTASSLWIVGCIGIAIGLGVYILSIFTSFLVMLLLILSKDKGENNDRIKQNNE